MIGQVVALVIAGGFVVLTVRMIRKHKEEMPVELLEGIPDEVRINEAADTPEARAFWEQLQRVFEDFERSGHHYPYRQFVDLLACGPRKAGALVAAHLSESVQLGVFGTDIQLRNELAEITAHVARDAQARDEREAYVALLGRLRELSNHNEEALEFWLRPQLEADLDEEVCCLRRRLHAVYVVGKLGTSEQQERVREVVEASEPDSPLRREYAVSRGEGDWRHLPPLPEPEAEPLPTYAELDEQARAHLEATRQAKRR